MSRLVLGLLLLCCMPAWSAPERMLRAAAMAESPPLDPAAPAWDSAPAVRIPLFPQSTTADGPGGAAKSLEARVLRGGAQLAVRLRWTDRSADMADRHATDRFADALAIQFAPPADTLPYIGMGEPDRPVRLWLWRAGGTPERLVARGFGTLASEGGRAPEARARRSVEGWDVVLRGEPGTLPTALAFAVWDGAGNGRAGRKHLSAWQALADADGQLPPALREEARLSGDRIRGERLFHEHGCVACHAPDVRLGPDLSHAGGIHWPGYLRRSIRAPAGFLVPGYPQIMPALDLQSRDVEDVVAYLMGLR
jgi:DMSO reductase family type II enzyme heme b subunit